MHVAFGADHAGFELKNKLLEFVEGLGHETVDLGTSAAASVDYPDYATAVARAVSEGRARLGILVCGTGLGMAITANKFRDVRAVTCSEPFSARMAREHNDANVLALGARVVGVGLAREVVQVFLETAFAAGRHGPRVDLIRALDC